MTSLLSEVVPNTHHGALDYAELERLGLEPDQVLDFSVNSNPFGPSPAVRDALALVPLERYPDREALALRRALATHLAVSVDQIVVGNGTAELLSLVAQAFLRPGGRAFVVEPTFGEYKRVSRLVGADTRCWRSRPEDGFVPAPAQVSRALDEADPDLAWICNPNNPTGVVMSPEGLRLWAVAHPRMLLATRRWLLACPMCWSSAP